MKRTDAKFVGVFVPSIAPNALKEAALWISIDDRESGGARVPNLHVERAAGSLMVWKIVNVFVAGIALNHGGR